ncbi:MAG: cobaltochelatase subunit CobN [Eubacteriaceae bacterium]
MNNLNILIISNPQYSKFNIPDIEDIQFYTLDSTESKKVRGDKYDAIIIFDHGDVENIKSYKELIQNNSKTIIIPVGNYLIEEKIYDWSLKKIIKFNSFFTYGGKRNKENAFLYLISCLLNEEDETIEAEKKPFDGMFHYKTNEVFYSFVEYEAWYRKIVKTNGKWVGILTHRQTWIDGECELIHSITKALENKGLKVIPAFTYGSGNESKSFKEIINDFFSNKKLQICGLINLTVFESLKENDRKNKDLLNQIVKIYTQLNIPIFQPVISYMTEEKTWRESLAGLPNEIPWNYSRPEKKGIIEPIVVALKNAKGETYILNERVKKFTTRVCKHIKLANISNCHKKIALVIHNAPCNGVEATIGLGVGLDVFESTVKILNRLKEEGYFVGDIPDNGIALRNILFEKKAFSDFRWTSVEDIVESGGCIYRMSVKEYVNYFNNIPNNSKMKMLQLWGNPPGEGMIYEEDIIITGIRFGNITLLVQPKRGCYGAKCTGEVCKILQDPFCPPPHFFFATYRWLEKIERVDCMVSIGTHGCIEFLPGKANALSEECWPDIIVGDLPHFYIYNAGVSTEGVTAKRRSYGVIIDHLPHTVDSADKNMIKLLQSINEYQYFKSIVSEQSEYIKKDILELIKSIPGTPNRINDFDKELDILKRHLSQTINNPARKTKHIFGDEATYIQRKSYLSEWFFSQENINKLLNSTDIDRLDFYTIVDEYIECIIADKQYVNSNIPQEILDIKPLMIELNNLLKKSNMEMENIIRLLSGEYIAPGISGLPDDNAMESLPTGRNLYISDDDKIPTRSAWQVGKEYANTLVDKYIKEEGKYPEKIAFNMISLDISRSKGEQLSTIMYLIGVKPIWDKKGKVTGIGIIDTKELARPRIDVTIRISGVLRDTYPNIINMLDRAFVRVAWLDEKVDENYIKKHSFEIIENNCLKDIDDDQKRRGSIRIFGDAPGGYGAGIDLALKASAWEKEEDLVKTFIDFSCYAYGNKLDGDRHPQEFVENMKNTNISFESSLSNKYTPLSSSFSSSVQGGIKLLKQIVGKNDIKQYYGNSQSNKVEVDTLEHKLKEELENTILNPIWRENIMEKGYDGAAEMMMYMQNTFSWKILTESIDDKLLDQIADEVINDKKVKDWFNEHNPYAYEEMARRLFELIERGKWQANEDVLNKLKRNYLEIEGQMEDIIGETKGEIQGGNIEKITFRDVEIWEERISQVEKCIKSDDEN